MISPEITAATPDPNRAAAIARAERLRGMIERLAEIGMAMAEEIGERHVGSAYHPEPRHEPGRSFASVSRAVRLSVAMVLRLDADIVAMCNGEALPRAAASLGSASSAPAIAPAFAFAKSPPCPVREKVREAVHAVIDGEIGDVDVAMLALDRAHETLTERDEVEAFLDRPLRDCVAAICADLGLEPDWSRWSDDAGFVAPEAGPVHDWSRLWTYDPEYLEARRKRKAQRPPAPSLRGGSNREASGVGEPGPPPQIAGDWRFPAPDVAALVSTLPTSGRENHEASGSGPAYPPRR